MVHGETDSTCSSAIVAQHSRGPRCCSFFLDGFCVLAISTVDRAGAHTSNMELLSQRGKAHKTSFRLCLENRALSYAFT